MLNAECLAGFGRAALPRPPSPNTTDTSLRPDLDLSPLEDHSSMRGLRLKCRHAVRTEIITVGSRRPF